MKYVNFKVIDRITGALMEYVNFQVIDRITGTLTKYVKFGPIHTTKSRSTRRVNILYQLLFDDKCVGNPSYERPAWYTNIIYIYI